MATKYDKAVKMDPLQQAMQVYQMFNNPNNNDLDTILGFVQGQQTQQQRQGEFEQSRGLKERELEQGERDIATRGRLADVEEKKLQQAGKLSPEQLQVYTTLYTDSQTPAPMKLMAKSVLPPELVAQIDAQTAQLTGDITGPGRAQAQPAAGGAGIPGAGGGPVEFGRNLGTAVQGMFAGPQAQQLMSPEGISLQPAYDVPGNIWEQIMKIFSGPAVAPPVGYQSALNRPRKE